MLSFAFQPWQLFLAVLAGWVHRQQQELIDYLVTENQFLKEKLGNKRILLTDDQRRRLAVKGKIDWRTFLKAHGDVLASVGFTTVEVWTTKGLVTYYLLFVMELQSRRVHFAGCTTSPNQPWVEQVARNLTDCEDGFVNGKKYLLMDRNTKFTKAFRQRLKDSGIRCLRLPPRSPKMSAHIERFMRSINSEALSRVIFFGESSFRRATVSYLEHHHHERNHQGLGNRIIEPKIPNALEMGDVKCKEKLGGILRYYHRAEA